MVSVLHDIVSSLLEAYKGSRAAVFCNIWVNECGGYVPFVSAAPDAP